MIIQWLTDERFGQTQPAEIHSNPIEFKDPNGQIVSIFKDVIMSNGIEYSMDQNGIDFVILENPLDQLSLIDFKTEASATKSAKESNAAAANDPLGYNKHKTSENSPATKHDKFIVDLHKRSKKSENITVPIYLKYEFPTPEAVNSMMSTFDDSTIDDFIEYIVDTIDKNALKSQLAKSIKDYYKIKSS